MFYLGSHFTFFSRCCCCWVVGGGAEKDGRLTGHRCVSYVHPRAVAVWHIYVIRVGGDYLIGRFLHCPDAPDGVWR
jgi:hypothetical protein